MSRQLAEYGASVMRITAPHITDFTPLNVEMGWGKWQAALDLRKEDDRQTLRDLVSEADVFLDGYRPYVLDKYGFGKDDILKMAEERGRGIVYAHENCYVPIV